MKLKTIILATAAAGTLLASTASMATFKLVNETSVPLIFVNCGTGVKLTVAIALPWKSIENGFLGGDHGTCHFYTSMSATTEMGSGYMQVNSAKTAGTLSNAVAASGYIVDINGTTVTHDHPQTSPITADNVVVTISNASKQK